MATKTIGQIKTAITPRLQGTSLNKIGDFYLICREAAEIMMNRADFQELRRKALLPNAVYDKVYDYSIPSDFKAPICLNTQSEKKNNADLLRTYSNQFTNQKKNNQFAIVWHDGIQFLKFAQYLEIPITIDKADSLTENGTWVASSGAYNLSLDTGNYISGVGSLKCDISSPGSVVSVSMKLGNDSSNYYEKTVTTGHFEAFTTGWNLLRFDLSDATRNGTIDMSTIGYIEMTVTYNTSQTAILTKTLTETVDLTVDNYKSDGSIFMYMDFATKDSLSVLRLDNITANIGTLYNIDYYSNLLFRSASGTWIYEPTHDSDIVNLSPLSYKIFEAEICKIITQHNENALGILDYNHWCDILEGDGQTEGLYDQYERMYPSERIEGQTDYWQFTDPFDLYNNEDEEGWGTNNSNYY